MPAIRDDITGLKLLGAKKTEYPTTVDPGLLETFPNRYLDSGYSVTFTCPEFTSLCPKTGQPDFGAVEIFYIPDKLCVESKSLKLYLFSYRGEGTFMETLTNRILEDLIRLCDPRLMVVTGEFNPRGGIGMTVVASYDRKLGKKTRIEAEEKVK